MPVFRKIAVCVVLASYLFANTVASSLHDHGDCCSHSEGAHDHTVEGAKPNVHREGGKHCCHHRHVHGHKQAPATCQNPTCQNQGPSRNPASHSSRQEQDSGSRHESHHCVVCDFLALAPLAATQMTLDLAGEVLPEFVILDVLPVSSTTVETHLARGPPRA